MLSIAKNARIRVLVKTRSDILATLSFGNVKQSVLNSRCKLILEVSEWGKRYSADISSPICTKALSLASGNFLYCSFSYYTTERDEFSLSVVISYLPFFICPRAGDD